MPAGDFGTGERVGKARAHARIGRRKGEPVSFCMRRGRRWKAGLKEKKRGGGAEIWDI